MHNIQNMITVGLLFGVLNRHGFKIDNMYQYLELKKAKMIIRPKSEWVSSSRKKHALEHIVH